MTKGLVTLEAIKRSHYVDGRLPLIDKLRFEIVEKELKALKILSKYNLHITLRPFLTEEEFNLIKEISQNE